MALTKINANAIEAGAITADKIAAGAITADKVAAGVSLGSAAPTIATVAITDASYNDLDDTAVDVAGGYIKIAGTEFQSGCAVMIGLLSATSVTFTSATELRVQVPAQAAGTYPIYVINPDGVTAARLMGLTYSGFPAWSTASTLPNGVSDTAYTVTLSATDAVSYSLAAGSSLPSGLTLNSSTGVLSGTVSVGSETTYTFTVIATDAENQDSPRTFSLTVALGGYRYWQVTINSVNGAGSQTQISEMSLANSSGSVVSQSIYYYAGTGTTTIQATNGTPIANMTNGTADSAQHSNFSTLPFTFRYDLGSAKTLGTDVKYLKVGSSDDSNRYPNSITVRASNASDFSTYTPIISGSPPGYAGVNQIQNWTLG